MWIRQQFCAASFAAFAFLLAASAAQAQALLSVNPVTIRLLPGQKSTVITVSNESDIETSFQVRAFTWNQDGGRDRIKPTDALILSPPLGVIAKGATQTIRLVLRRQPQGHEDSYRIVFDQIPPPGAPGTVRVALQLYLPVFAEPVTRIAARVQWRIERAADQAYLTAINEGTRHERFRDISVATAEGATLKPESTYYPPYVLAGATRRWLLLGKSPVPAPGATLRLTGQADGGKIDQVIRVVQSP